MTETDKKEKADQFAVILAAAGQSRRFFKNRSGFSAGISQKKTFTLLQGKAVWLHSAQKFANRPEVKQIILVVSPEDRSEVEQKYSADLAFLQIEIALGGSERWQSVENALRQVRPEIDFVAVHDAARPCISDRLIESVFYEARRTGAAIPASPVCATLKRGRKIGTSDSESKEKDPSDLGSERKLFFDEKKNTEQWRISETVDRSGLWEAQTPQVFRRDLLDEACQKRGSMIPTDDAQLVEALGKNVALVPSDLLNLKITTERDLQIADKFLDIINRRSVRSSLF